ncbi:MAG: SGNH/GDSL hydrolase family protein, partial [Candidatus Saccharimonadales bacterium]
PDGRYVAVTDARFTLFRLYDLSTCQDRAEGSDMIGRCRFLNLWPILDQRIPSFAGVSGVRFKGDNTMELYSGSRPDGVNLVRSHYLISAQGFSDPGYEYLGIGDSFASGEGAYQYKATTDVKNNKCHLSERAYPFLLAKELNFSQFNSVACSGAIIKDILTTNSNYIGQVHDGIKLKDRDIDNVYSNFVAGEIPQRKFIEKYQPKIVTMSVGGNDIGFGDKITRCLGTDTCYDTYEERLGAVNEVNTQFDRLVGVYNDVKSTGDPRAKVYVIGYPQVGDENGNCAANVHLNHGELAFTRQYISYLNSVVRTAADKAGVYYVDVENAFEGHKLCQTDSWNTAVNGLTAGNDIVNVPLVHGPIGNESFHPNALGHKLLEAEILKQTARLTAPMPMPDPTKKLQLLASDAEILQRPHSNKPVKNMWFYPGVKEGQANRSAPVMDSYNGKDLALKGSSPVQLVLTSDPVLLGEFTTDAKGNLDVSVTIPATVPSGFHTLHLYAKNIIDEDVDVYQTIFVGSNGDSGSCKVVPDSGQDADKDNIDDACDGLIDKAPVVIVTPPPAPTQPTKPTTRDIVRKLFVLLRRLFHAMIKHYFVRL